MKERIDDKDRTILLARKAAEQLFNTKGLESSRLYEPQCLSTAQAAVHRLGELFENLPGSVADALEAAGTSGELLSGDRLQGVAEILQNADDIGASKVRILLRGHDLLVAHNGREMRLKHVLGLAMPWLSTKRAESQTFGRFGIGLSALRSISDRIDVHCGLYNIRLGNPVLSSITPPIFPTGFDQEGWTVFRVSLTQGGVSKKELVRWINRWGDAGLLFLQSISKVTLLGTRGETICRLSVDRDRAKSTYRSSSTLLKEVRRQHVNATDGSSWMVYSAEVPTPVNVARTYKKTESTTPVGVALPLHHVDKGQIYAGLPVVNTPLPVFLNAQFDPLTSRRDLADTPWNRALVPLVADVWSYAAIDLFRLSPSRAWPAIPTRRGPPRGVDSSSIVERIGDALVDRARKSVAMQIRLKINDKGWFRLDQLATEAKPLEDVVTEDETAMLLEKPASLPKSLRDTHEKWRAVLEDWREAGAAIPETLSVERALELLHNTERSVTSTIALVATGIRNNLADRLIKLPCLVASDESRLMPPSADSPHAVAVKTSPLAQELGLVSVLHARYGADSDDARETIDWLRQREALLDGEDDRIVVDRLASAGRSGNRIKEPLTDGQVDALRRAFEALDPSEARELGHDVGRAITLPAYVHELRSGRKRKRELATTPSDAYLPRSIDRSPDGFAMAAEKAPDIVWLSPHYARILKSSAGRAGIGAQRFLTLLGAETAPRPNLHRDLTSRYFGSPKGLPASNEHGPAIRTQAMKDLNATYTLQDWECHDLTAVVSDIARVRQARKRRTRSRALLATMARAWERLRDAAEVESVSDYYGWNKKGPIPAFWLWQIRDIAWLDDESGTPRCPSELRIRTPGTIAIYGQNSPDFLHEDLENSLLDRRNTLDVMTAIGVTGDPTRKELVARLKEMRREVNEGSLTDSQAERDTAIIYRALALSLENPVARADFRETDLRNEFQKMGGLILTNLGWRSPEKVLAGPSVFSDYEAFAPPIPETEQLWDVLGLETPSLTNCVAVLRKISRQRRPLSVEDEAVQIQTLRVIEAQLSSSSLERKDRRKLAELRLWTSEGWKSDRPVFSTDDESLADGLKQLIPLWQPGGELDQFRSLLKLLKVEDVSSSSAEVVDPKCAYDDAESTDQFRATVRQLQEDFARNEPNLLESLSINWDTLAEFQVQVHPELELDVPVKFGEDIRKLRCKTPVRVEPESRIIFVENPHADLPRADRGGRAVSTLFKGDRRRVAQAWRTAWDLAEVDRSAVPLVLAQQRDKQREEEIEATIDMELESLQNQTSGNSSSPNERSRQDLSASGAQTIRGERSTGDDAGIRPRVLVNPSNLRLVDPAGRIVGSSTVGRPPQRMSNVLSEPRERTQSPQNRVSLREYSDLDRENVGFELARRVLSSDRAEIVDLRTQCGVGADAMDGLKRFFELKVIAGNEPKSVSLTNSELQRAQKSPHFFLVVVSGLEGTDATPTVRIIPEPLEQLEQTIGGRMTLGGIQEAKSLKFDLEPIESRQTSNNETLTE